MTNIKKFKTDMTRTENEYDHVFFTTDMKSKTYDTRYSLEACLKKGLVRAELTCNDHDIYLEKKGDYGDRDLILFVEELKCSDSLWTDSVSFTITGEIPLHQTGSGKLSLGFRVGSDFEAAERHKKVGVPALVMCLQPNTDNFNSIVIIELLKSKVALEMLLRVIQRFLSEKALDTI